MSVAHTMIECNQSNMVSGDASTWINSINSKSLHMC